MRVLDRTAFLGANLYARYPVIRLRVDLGALEEWPSARLGEEFIAPLLAALPGLASHGCSYSTAGGFVRRLREGAGTWMGHILEHVALELQQLAGAPVTFGKTRSAGGRGRYDVVYACVDPEVGLRAGSLAERLLGSLLPPPLNGRGAPGPVDLASEVSALVALAQRRALAAQLSAPGRAPRVVIIAGVGDPSDSAEALAGQLRGADHTVGVSRSGGAATEQAVATSGVDVAVLATTSRLLTETGLGVTRSDAAVVLGRPRGADDPLHLALELAPRTLVLADAAPAGCAAAVMRLLGER